MKETKLYRFLRPIIKVLTNIVFRPKYIGLDNIPKNSKIILAGTHTNILDCLVLISSTKRSVHFLAKKELWKGPKKLLFANMGLIPVKRRKKDKEVLKLSQKALDNNGLICIFPEGTTQKGRGLMPFKIGAVKMAYDNNTKIVPFAITGKYIPFINKLTIKFGKQISIASNLDEENERLRNIIKDMLEDE